MSALREMFVEAPASREIAEALNAADVQCCEHGRSPCYLRCGVRCVTGRWEAIPQAERRQWLADVEHAGESK